MKDVYDYAKFFIKNGAENGEPLFQEQVLVFDHGVAFYSYGDLELTDEIRNQLESFSLSADDDAYSVYVDNGRLVIY